MFYVFFFQVRQPLQRFCLQNKGDLQKAIVARLGVDMFIHHWHVTHVTGQGWGGGGGEGQRYVYILDIKKGSAYVGRFCIFL